MGSPVVLTAIVIASRLIPVCALPFILHEHSPTFLTSLGLLDFGVVVVVGKVSRGVAR